MGEIYHLLNGLQDTVYQIRKEIISDKNIPLVIVLGLFYYHLWLAKSCNTLPQREVMSINTIGIARYFDQLVERSKLVFE